MATAPKPSLKQRLAGTVEGRTPRFLLGSLVLAMVMSVLAGIGIGMKVEQHRGTTDSAGPVAGSTTKPAVSPPLKIVRGTLKGSLTQVKPKWLALTNATGRKAILFAPVVLVDLTTAATASEIKTGDRVVVRGFKAAPATTSSTIASSSTSTIASSSTSSAKSRTPTALAANKIILVNGKGADRLGRVVTATTPTSITVTNLPGPPVTVLTAGATILKTVKGAKTDLVPGRKVVIRTLLSAPRVVVKGGKPKRVPLAFEVLVLPAASPFG